MIDDTYAARMREAEDYRRSLGRPAAEPLPSICGRVLVGRGSDTYDPLCTRPAHHDEGCEP